MNSGSQFGLLVCLVPSCPPCAYHMGFNMIQGAKTLSYREKIAKNAQPVNAAGPLFKQILACRTLREELLKRGTKGRIAWIVLSAMQLQ